MITKHQDPADTQNSGTRAATRTAAKATEIARQTIVEELSSLLFERRNRAAAYVLSLGAALDSAAARLQEDGHNATAEQLSEISDLFENTGHNVAEYGVRDLVSDAARTAQRNPAVTFGLAALAAYAVVKVANADRDSDVRRRRG